MSMSTNVLEAAGSTDMGPRAGPERLIIMILVGTILLSFVAWLTYYFYRRHRQRASRRLQEDLEEGREEVIEARELRLQDDSLHGGSYTPFAAENSNSRIHVPAPALPTPAAFRSSHQPPMTPTTVLARIKAASTADVDAHPLFHPGIKRSRTLPRQSAPRYSTRSVRGAMSYPNIYADGASLKSHISTISLGSYYRAVSKPITPSYTMQTRRCVTPPIPEMPPESEPLPPPKRHQIHSIWSVSDTDTESITPSSPSIYSSMGPIDPSPRPPPSPFGFDEFPSTESKPLPYPANPVTLPIDTPIRAIVAMEFDPEETLPALSYPRPLLLRKSSSAMPMPPPPPALPQSPPHFPRARAPSGPSRASVLSQVSEPPRDKIERWLSGSGSTGTASIIAAVLGTKRGSSSSELDISLTRTADSTHGERVSPVRSQTSSQRSLQSGEELIFIGAAF